MRVCDRHPDRRASDRIAIDGDGAVFDVCAECKTELLMFLAEPPDKLNGGPRRRGRPPKSATAENPAP